MKKYLAYIASALLALGFTACEDVPAPYTINNGGTDGGDDTNTTLISEDFSSSLGDFSAVCTEGNYPWAVSYSCAQVTSYVDSDGDGTKENNKAASYLISPAVDLTSVDSAHISFSYILRYANSSELATNYQILITDDYQSTPAATTWTKIDFTPTQGSDWDTWYTADVNVPAAYLHKENVRVALLYVADAKSATWEVKNFKMEKGAAASTGGDDTGDADTVKKLPYSETFATSLGAFTNYTTDGSGAWTIDYSTAKATGYDNTSKTTTAGTYYLVSPEISLEGQTAAHVVYDYILRYNKGDENQQLYITTSFDAANPAAGWTLLNGTHTEGSDWSTFASADIDIPAEYMGKTIRLAFRYNTNATSGSTWEVKNFTIAAGKAGDSTGGDDSGDTPSADDQLTSNGIKIEPAALGLDNATDVGTQTLSDGTVLTFDAGTNKNAPKYYTSGKNIRMYPTNSMKVTAKKTIASVYVNCDTYNGTVCNASGEVSASAGTLTVNDAVISVTGIGTSEVTITNASSTTGTASQIRAVSIVINYAD